jgi:hypothetical protein
MNYSYKLGLALLAVLGVNNAALGYKFTFSNHTAERVMIRLSLALDNKDWDVTLTPLGTPGQDGLIGFPAFWDDKDAGWELHRRAIHCWRSLKMKREIKDSSGKMVWGPWQEINVRYVESNQYLAMTSDSDKATSSIINVGLSAGGKESAGEGSEGIAKGIGSLVAHSQCKDRHFDVIYLDKKGKAVGLTTLAQ